MNDLEIKIIETGIMMKQTRNNYQLFNHYANKYIDLIESNKDKINYKYHLKSYCNILEDNSHLTKHRR